MAEVVWRDVVEVGWQKLGDVKIAKAEKAGDITPRAHMQDPNPAKSRRKTGPYIGP